MRSLPLIAASILVFATPLAARAQGTIGVSMQILAPEELRMPGAMDGVKVERTKSGETSLSVPLVLTHRNRPTVSLQQRAGDPPCELISGGRSDEGWSTRLRCTTRPGPMRARLVIVPNT